MNARVPLKYILQHSEEQTEHELGDRTHSAKSPFGSHQIPSSFCLLPSAQYFLSICMSMSIWIMLRVWVWERETTSWMPHPSSWGQLCQGVLAVVYFESDCPWLLFQSHYCWDHHLSRQLTELMADTLTGSGPSFVVTRVGCAQGDKYRPWTGPPRK